MSLSVTKVKMHWVADDDRTECMQCRSPFGLMRRRHHCRFCGEIFCADCCAQKLTAKRNTRKPHRHTAQALISLHSPLLLDLRACTKCAAAALGRNSSLSFVRSVESSAQAAAAAPPGAVTYGSHSRALASSVSSSSSSLSSSSVSSSPASAYGSVSAPGWASPPAPTGRSFSAILYPYAQLLRPIAWFLALVSAVIVYWCCTPAAAAETAPAAAATAAAAAGSVWWVYRWWLSPLYAAGLFVALFALVLSGVRAGLKIAVQQTVPAIRSNDTDAAAADAADDAADAELEERRNRLRRITTYELLEFALSDLSALFSGESAAAAAAAAAVEPAKPAVHYPPTIASLASSSGGLRASANEYAAAATRHRTALQAQHLQSQSQPQSQPQSQQLTSAYGNGGSGPVSAFGADEKSAVVVAAGVSGPGAAAAAAAAAATPNAAGYVSVSTISPASIPAQLTVREAEWVRESHAVMDTVWNFGTSNDGWNVEAFEKEIAVTVLSRTETTTVKVHAAKNPPHFTKSAPKSYKIFKCYTFVAAKPVQLFELFRDLPNTPTWNKAITRYTTLQQLTADIDTTLCVAAPQAGGAVSSRDFVGVRQCMKRGSAYVIAGTGIVCDDIAPDSKDSIRGWNGPGGFTITPVAGRESESVCQVSWLLNGDMRGWLPRSLIESTCKSVMIGWAHNVRQTLLARHGLKFQLVNGQVVPQP